MLAQSGIINRYLLISDRNGNLVYGEKVIWQLTEFDKILSNELRISLPNNCFALLIDSIIDIETYDCGNGQISFKTNKVNVLFKYTDAYDDWVYLSNSETLFNPLIDYCSKVSGYINRAADSGFDFIHSNEDLQRSIKEKFNIDFSANPETINSFVKYTPTRVLIDSRFLDKPKPNEDRIPRELEIRMLDEFGEYQNNTLDICVILEGRAENYTANIKDKSFMVTLSEFPKELSYEIKQSKNLIYFNRHGFIRRINVGVNAIVGSVMLESGKKQEIVRSMNFVVGDE